MINLKKLLTTATACALLISLVRAEEGGSGHYVPGTTSDFMDTVPGKPAFVLADAYTHYSGSATPPIDFGGKLTLNANARINADKIFGLYETPLTLLGGNYAAVMAIPYGLMGVDGNVKANWTARRRSICLCLAALPAWARRGFCLRANHRGQWQRCDSWRFRGAEQWVSARLAVMSKNTFASAQSEPFFTTRIFPG